MKKTGALLLLMAAMLVAVPAYKDAWAAQGGQGGQGGYGYGYHHPEGPRGYYQGGPGWNHPDVTPEKRAAYEKIMTEYRAKIQPIQNDICAKQMELDYLSQNGQSDAKSVTSMVAELKALREKAQALNNTTAGRLAKDLDISSDHAYSLLGRGGNGWGGCGAGYGPGSRGMRHGGGFHRGAMQQRGV